MAPRQTALVSEASKVKIERRIEEEGEKDASSDHGGKGFSRVLGR